MRLLILFFVTASYVAHGQRLTINGLVRDESSGENLIGATIIDLNTSAGTTSNTYGFFSLTLPPDSVKLRVSYVGYTTSIVNFALKRDTTINIFLTNGQNLKEITITDNSEIQETTQMGTIDVPLHNIKSMPALLGETDVLKAIQLLPGVQGGVEGSSGLYVRGGGPDQNLILLDGVPVYNASHLFGFISVFNADAINHVELVKGGFPARYGGRLSSVIDISMKEGNSKELKGEGSIGLIASRLTVEGPIKKDRTSFIISARRTYFDVLTAPLIKLASDDSGTAGYYFYDLNAKINHKINGKNRIYFSTYLGDDRVYARFKDNYTDGTVDYKYKEEFGLRWGNVTTALRWNSILSQKIFSNVTATFSRYRFTIFDEYEETRTSGGVSEDESYKNAYISGIRDFALRWDLDFIPSPNHYIKFGTQAIAHTFTPGVFSLRSTENDTTIGAQIIDAQEYFAYLEDDFRVSERLKVNAGLHLSGFQVRNEFYHSLQPRFAMRFLITPVLSAKASYARMTQYIHLLTNAGLGLPTDLWVPATEKIGPQQAAISSLGVVYNHKSAYEFSVEGYYKTMSGLIEYKDGASFTDIESDWQEKVEVGKGESYGAEFFVQKKSGPVTGWVGYTLSWTNRTFENLNFGRTFPYKYDRRHDLETTIAYSWKENKDLALTWVYGTGVAVSLPSAQYQQNHDPLSPNYNNSIDHYDGRNNYRMNPYHRLDLSYTTKKKTKFGERSWTIAIYNVYSRRNPFFMDIGYDKKGNKKFIQYSLFPIIPSIAYRFKF